MPPRSRYAVDPSLIANTFQPAYNQPSSHSQHHLPQPPHHPHLHPDLDHRTPSVNEYAPSTSRPTHHIQSIPNQASSPSPSSHPSSHAPPHHIPPPPHSFGPAITGPRKRIDPEQVPNPVEAQELDQNLYDDDDFLSCDPRGLMPLSGTDWRGIDQGNSLPRHLRPTLLSIPTNSQLLETTALPLGLIVQPFAPLRYDEAPVPLVSNWTVGQSAFATSQQGDNIGPPRCDKCRAYINPHVRWVEGGRKWTCNLCSAINPLPDAYFCHLSPSGQRLDHDERPELLHGTVDFAVPQEYWSEQALGSLLDTAVDNSAANLASAGDALATTAVDLLGGLQNSLGQSALRQPSPAHGHKKKGADERSVRRPRPLGRVFVVDVTGPSAQNGVVREVCDGIRRALYGQRRSEDSNGDETEADEGVIGDEEQVAIVSFAESVGFWNLSPSLPAPSLMVVSDLDDMFVPLIDGFLVSPRHSRTQIESLLDLLPSIAGSQPEGNQPAAGAAVRGALAGLRMRGGQINLFLASLPTLGPGKLDRREDPTVQNTDKERTLFTSADPFWRNTSEELAEAGVGCNVFFFPQQYIDVASVGTLCSVTGGEAFFHPKFSPVRDRETLQDELKRVCTRETVYNATVRIRCSTGLRVADHIGNFYQRSLTDLEFGTIDDAKAFAAVLRHDGHKLDERSMAYVQVAVLYTSANGERRVRCLNLSLAMTALIGNVFRFADLDASVTLFMKDAVSQMPSKGLRDIRKALTDRCNRVLYMYRRHCAPAVAAGQLILPEGFKLLPLYTLCMLKSKPLKGGNVTSDVRAHYMRVFSSLSVINTMNLLYPRLLAIHDLSPDAGFLGPNGRLRMPAFMRASYAYMVAEGAYLLSNGESAMIWFGASVSPQIIDDLYAVEALEELDPRMTRLPKLPTLLSTQVRNILTHLERLAGHSLQVIIVRQNMDGMEIEFANQLVEDSNNDALSYTDYLMTAHKSITNELSGGTSEGWKAPWSS
ncbi:hypothetical protein TREMEDRAFT_35099 [Tremella mesenterica DSM 1558]|uniref:uncharacterized protein n=1 Tax=Tremella mesenterica (strain ATCC 24925 / CBS 8224 / DSM 1558 / NBRC 9311 / NRRL Y-6157 / RJB 2259-6 / UBC 559-6) TaxID=578456 RepID=UPI00032D4835|nr:uncharacterized protein TREMEDRAFT_35099 [Tremella mesenterica DSM 1558]EIW66261.1 hypothetical protein TREMEDRAFT_35099 [Tremella mesenterica DSM 1558]